MHPVLLKIAEFEIPSYGVMILLGIVLAFSVVYFFGNTNLKKDNILNLVIVSIISGFIGAKVLFLITISNEIVGNLTSGNFDFEYFVSILRGGFVFYGGLIGGILGIIIYCKKMKIDIRVALDAFSLGLPLAQGFGRLGCFLAGCCYGKESETFGLYFNESLIAPHSEKLIPTQLIESIFCFLLFIILFLLTHLNTKLINIFLGKPFTLSIIYLFTYSVFRFFIEFFRGDESRGIIFNISVSQIVSLVIIAFLIIYLGIGSRNKSKSDL